LLKPLVQRLKRGSLGSQVRKAVDAGIGVYNRTWPLDEALEAPLQEAESPGAKAHALTAQVLDWCRFTMGQMRKPYGVDYVSLIIAVLGSGDRELAELNLGVLRPQEFYGDDGIARQVEEALVHWEEQDLLSAKGGTGPPRLVTLLFSWGDLTRELLLTG
jgi:hypothetical protein